MMIPTIGGEQDGEHITLPNGQLPIQLEIPNSKGMIEYYELDEILGGARDGHPIYVCREESCFRRLGT